MKSFLRLLKKKSRELNVRKIRKLKLCVNLKSPTAGSEENFIELFPVLFNVKHYITFIVDTIYIIPCKISTGCGKIASILNYSETKIF